MNDWIMMFAIMKDGIMTELATVDYSPDIDPLKLADDFCIVRGAEQVCYLGLANKDIEIDFYET